MSQKILANLSKLPARRPLDILAHLASWRREPRGESIPIPEVSLLLRGQHSLSGAVLDVDAEKGAVLLGRDHDPSALMYVPIDAIVAVQLHAEAAALPRLSFGRVQTMPAEILSRMKLIKALRAMREDLSERLGTPLEATIVWEGLPDNDGARVAIAALVKSLHECLMDITSDAMGTRCLADRVASLSIESGDAAGVVVESRTLKVRGVVAGDAVRFDGPDRIKAGIEALL